MIYFDIFFLLSYLIELTSPSNAFLFLYVGYLPPECMSKLSSLVDFKHSCGYLTLLDLPKPTSAPEPAAVPSAASRKPENGKVKSDAALLLASEVDSVSEKKSLKLELSEASITEEPRDHHWTLLDVHFGIPLFEPELNRKICKRIVDKELWKKDRCGWGRREMSYIFIFLIFSMSDAFPLTLSFDLPLHSVPASTC